MIRGKITFRRSLLLIIPLILLLFFVFFTQPILQKMGSFLVVDETPGPSDAVVILNTGVEFYPRLIQAAEIYRQGLVQKVVFNGNRKTDTLRELESRGFSRSCPWYSDTLRILDMQGVQLEDIIWISAEDAYDTVSEATAVGHELLRLKFSKVIITTSKYHTRRARFIWKKMYENQMIVSMVAAKYDPYDPKSWWKDGRQIRWVLAEYGAWIYYWWKEVRGL
jgi:uncharacterized SAM-binding protein YcdF (DUF218 family)